ncbi:MAG: hypothetical protein K2O46_01490 [Bacteroidales bacterium]|nr:hypothetical protein [Bacteroidales bacterium]
MYYKKRAVLSLRPFRSAASFRNRNGFSWASLRAACLLKPFLLSKRKGFAKRNDHCAWSVKAAPYR